MRERFVVTLQLNIQKKWNATSVFLCSWASASGENMSQQMQLSLLGNCEHRSACYDLITFLQIIYPMVLVGNYSHKVKDREPLSALEGDTDRLVNSTHSSRLRQRCPQTYSFLVQTLHHQLLPQACFWNVQTVLQHKEGFGLPRMMTMLYLVALIFAFEMSPRW